MHTGGGPDCPALPFDAAAGCAVATVPCGGRPWQVGSAGIGMTARLTCHGAPSVARAVRVVAVAAAPPTAASWCCASLHFNANSRRVLRSSSVWPTVRAWSRNRRAPSPRSSSQSSTSSPQMIPGSAETPRPTITDQMTDPISGEPADLVESMIGRGRNGRQIWTVLMDHHDYLITYGSIRHCIRYARSRTAPARAEANGSATP